MVDSLCYAYNKQGQRCDQNAGPAHEDHHTFTVTWSDEENWTPDDGPLVVQAQPQEAAPAPVAADNPVVCFSCEHPWHDDACEAFIGKKSDGVVCGCSVAIA